MIRRLNQYQGKQPLLMRPSLSRSCLQIWEIEIFFSFGIEFLRLKSIVVVVVSTHFGAQIIAMFAKYPLEKAKKHIKIMNM